MSPRRTVLLAGLLFSFGAVAEPAAPPPPHEPHWSIGAGIGTSNPGLLSLSFPGFGNSSPQPFETTTAFNASLTPPLPSASVVLEMRIVGELWLLGRISGSFSQERTADAPQPGSNGENVVARQISTTGSSVLALGVRHRALAWGPVQASWFIVGNGTYFQNAVQAFVTAPSSNAPISPASTSNSTMTTWGVGLAVGLAIDVTVVEGVLLRIASPLANAGYLRGVFLPTKTSKETDSPTGQGFNAGAAFAPSLEVRLVW